jgi:hypothetical protein
MPVIPRQCRGQALYRSIRQPSTGKPNRAGSNLPRDHCRCPVPACDDAWRWFTAKRFCGKGFALVKAAKRFSSSARTVICRNLTMLRKHFGGKLGARGDEFIGHILSGALRMEHLLEDLRAYTQASTLDKAPPAEIRAEEALEKALKNLEVTIDDSKASITRSPLPNVCIHEFQLEQLFPSSTVTLSRN